MTRIQPIDPATAGPETAAHLVDATKVLGRTPNLILTAAQSPATVGAMVAMFANTWSSSIGGKAGEQIALAIAEVNGCGYCLSAHAAIGKMHGLNAAEIEAARRGVAADPKTSALISLALSIIESRGHVSDAVIAAARLAGMSDIEIVEVVGHVALSVFTNYLNSVAQTQIDFPEVALSAAV